MTNDDAVGQVVDLAWSMPGEYWEVPVEHAHAAFDRAVAGFDGEPVGTVVPELAQRRRSQETLDGR